MCARWELDECCDDAVNSVVSSVDWELSSRDGDMGALMTAGFDSRYRRVEIRPALFLAPARGGGVVGEAGAGVASNVGSSKSTAEKPFQSSLSAPTCDDEVSELRRRTMRRGLAAGSGTECTDRDKESNESRCRGTMEYFWAAT